MKKSVDFHRNQDVDRNSVVRAREGVKVRATASWHQYLLIVKLTAWYVKNQMCGVLRHGDSAFHFW